MNNMQHVIAAIIVGGSLFMLGALMGKHTNWPKTSEAAEPEKEEDHGIRLDREKDFPGYVPDGIRVRVISIDGQRFVVVYSRHGVAIEKMIEPWDVRP